MIRKKNCRDKTDKKKKILAVSSCGGHAVQLKKLKSIFCNYETTYVISYLTKEQKTLIDKSFYSYVIRDFSRNSNIQNVIPCFYGLIKIILKEKPDVIITTGAAPGVMAIIAGKLFGKKTIWIDSIANIERISRSGRIASLISNLILTQWEHLEGFNKAKYWGKVI